MLTCPACGDPIRKGDGFCEGCGHRLPPPCTTCGSPTVDSKGYCQRCGRLRPSSRDHVEIDLASIAGVSNRGLQHETNQDAMGALEYSYGLDPGVVAVVCDGVSNSPRPEEASQVAADTGTRVLVAQLEAGVSPEVATTAATDTAANAVNALADSPDDAPACTYVSAVVNETSVTVGWIGDSRAYWLGSGSNVPSALLTHDDSLVNHLVRTGEVSDSEASRHPNAHALVKWLGADAGDVAPQVVSFEPTGPGAVLICSDGLWNYIPDAENLAAAVPAAVEAPLPSARFLVQVALDAGGHDNITVVLIPFLPKGGRLDDRWF